MSLRRLGATAAQRWPLGRRGTVTLGAAAGLGLVGLAGVQIAGAALDARDLAPRGPGVQIALVDPPPPPPVEAGPRLEVLEGAPDGFTPPPPVPADPALDGEGADPLTGRKPGEDVWTEPAAPKPAPGRAGPQPDRTAGIDCGRAMSRAEAMICNDARLSAADRRLRRTLARVLDEGRVDRRRVLADQASWEWALDRAALDGPGALDRLYRIRQEELERALD
ncbi:hypothetical protein HCU40_23835 [Pseudanabaena biceps]|nr:hypothetical protein [Pseudanabaena biceps]